jgi:hypothetical protein
VARLRTIVSGSRVLGVALLVGAVVLLGLAQTGPGGDALGSLGLRSPSEGYTELGFKASGSLPERVTAPTATPDMPFIVGNREGGDRTYRWIIQARDRHGVRQVATGTTPRLASGSSLIVTPRVRLACAEGRVRVIVRLVRPAQSIAYWTRCGKAAS